MNIKQQDPATGAKINKNVGSKDYYAYRLMIRCNRDNVILRCRDLCHKFMVDTYVKIETERLRYLDSMKKSCVRKILKTIVRYW
jgi:hypothetical protein